MADNDVQDMVRQIRKTLPTRLGDMTPDDLKNHLVDVKNNPTQYGLPGFDVPGASDVIFNAGAQIEEQHTAIKQGQVQDFLKALDTASKQSGKDPATIAEEWQAQARGQRAPAGDDPGGDLIMDIGTGSVGDPSTGPPPGPSPDASPDPGNIDDLFEPTAMGPLPKSPLIDPELEELLEQTDALRPPGDPVPLGGVDVLTDPTGDAMAAVPMDPTTIAAPPEPATMPEGGGSEHAGSGETPGFSC
jgi:hypothetical protein